MVVPVKVMNEGKHAARGIPVSAGVPFPRGALMDPSVLRLADPDRKPVALQAGALARWPDGSCRWVLLDFTATAKGGAEASYSLRSSGKRPDVMDPVSASSDATGVVLANGRVTVRVSVGESCFTLAAADGRPSVRVVPVARIGGERGPIASTVKISSFEVHASGPLRAAVSLKGERCYDDGQIGPFAQEVELFAGSPYVRVEDTFVYAHLPGSHAIPEHPLLSWGVSVHPAPRGARVDLVPLLDPEESEGLVVSKNAVMFWGTRKPLDLSRWTDEDLIGEDARGISLGVGKSCALWIGLEPSAKEAAAARCRLWACATPEVYAASRALGEMAPARKGRFGKVEEGMRQALGFWLWFQDHDPDGLWGKGPWHGFLDWGDWQSRYADRKNQPTGWNYLEGRYGWDCNEMDTALGLWSAFMRTGRRSYHRAARAMSRHAMDVDTIHVDYRNYGIPEHVYDNHHYEAPWSEGRDRMQGMSTVGLGRRHNVQHWGNGVGDTRHSWNGGIMLYHYLTGNRRARDVALSIAEMHMQRMWGSAAGEYALSLWAIYNAWQMTGQRRYLEELDYRVGVVRENLTADGGLAEHLDLVHGTDYPEVDKGSAYLDLILDYASNALIDYEADTEDSRAREILWSLADRIMKDDPPAGASDYRFIDTVRLLAWAYQETGDRRFLERATFHLRSLAASPLSRPPRTASELLAATYGLLQPFDWDIRVVGPLIRMAPYAMHAASSSSGSGA